LVAIFCVAIAKDGQLSEATGFAAPGIEPGKGPADGPHARRGVVGRQSFRVVPGPGLRSVLIPGGSIEGRVRANSPPLTKESGAGRGTWHSSGKLPVCEQQKSFDRDRAL
jgi:hypothetical protein